MCIRDRGKIAVLIDDMIDTAGTLSQAANALAAAGATHVYGVSTHAVCSGPAVERIRTCSFERVFVTDTIPLGDKQDELPMVEVQSTAAIFADAIRAIHFDDSISRLFLRTSN